MKIYMFGQLIADSNDGDEYDGSDKNGKRNK